MGMGQKMDIEEEYAKFILAASALYAGQSKTPCRKSESKFEQGLFKLFRRATKSGVALQDIVVISSTALAAILTEPHLLDQVEDPVIADTNLIPFRRAS